MLTTPNIIPDASREDPQFESWASVFDALSQCQRPGEAVFNFAGLQPSGQIAAFLWLEGHARYGIIALGGHYSVAPATFQWDCQGANGRVPVPDPRQLTNDAAMAMRDEIRQQTNFDVFVIPVAVFTDMEPDPAIERLVHSTNVRAVFGAHRLLADLDAIPQGIEVRHPPTAKHVQNEAQALKRAFGLDGVAQPAAPVNDDAGQATVDDLSLAGRSINITINRVDQLIVRPGPGDGPIFQN